MFLSDDPQLQPLPEPPQFDDVQIRVVSSSAFPVNPYGPGTVQRVVDGFKKCTVLNNDILLQRIKQLSIACRVCGNKIHHRVFPSQFRNGLIETDGVGFAKCMVPMKNPYGGAATEAALVVPDNGNIVVVDASTALATGTDKPMQSLNAGSLLCNSCAPAERMVLTHKSEVPPLAIRPFKERHAKTCATTNILAGRQVSKTCECQLATCTDKPVQCEKTVSTSFSRKGVSVDPRYAKSSLAIWVTWVEIAHSDAFYQQGNLPGTVKDVPKYILLEWWFVNRSHVLLLSEREVRHYKTLMEQSPADCVINVDTHSVFHQFWVHGSCVQKRSFQSAWPTVPCFRCGDTIRPSSHTYDSSSYRDNDGFTRGKFSVYPAVFLRKLGAWCHEACLCKCRGCNTNCTLLEEVAKDGISLQRGLCLVCELGNVVAQANRIPLPAPGADPALLENGSTIPNSDTGQASGQRHGDTLKGRMKKKLKTKQLQLPFNTNQGNISNQASSTTTKRTEEVVAPFDGIFLNRTHGIMYHRDLQGRTMFVSGKDYHPQAALPTESGEFHTEIYDRPPLQHEDISDELVNYEADTCLRDRIDGTVGECRVPSNFADF